MCTDCSTHWRKAQSFIGITVQLVAQSFVNTWIRKFGVLLDHIIIGGVRVTFRTIKYCWFS